MDENEKQLVRAYITAFILTSLVLCFVILCAGVARAEVIPSDTALLNAIYKAENSVKYPYGIKSINTHGNKDYARKICLNTIRNHKKRHAKHNCGLDFITCLGNRYCPPTAHSLNRNWVKLVKYFLTKHKNTFTDFYTSDLRINPKYLSEKAGKENEKSR